MLSIDNKTPLPGPALEREAEERRGSTLKNGDVVPAVESGEVVTRHWASSRTSLDFKPRLV